jgi:hypothetical protein
VSFFKKMDNKVVGLSIITVTTQPRFRTTLQIPVFAASADEERSLFNKKVDILRNPNSPRWRHAVSLPAEKDGATKERILSLLLSRHHHKEVLYLMGLPPPPPLTFAQATMRKTASPTGVDAFGDNFSKRVEELTRCGAHYM